MLFCYLVRLCDEFLLCINVNGESLFYTFIETQSILCISFLMSGLLHVPGGTVVSEEASCIVDHACLILLLSAQRAALPPRKPLKGLQTCSVENMRTRQQHLKRNSDISCLVYMK